MKSVIIFFVFLLSGTCQLLIAQVRWSFELSGGAPLNIPFPLRIEQDNQAVIEIKSPKFYSEPFVLPVYWDWRFSRITKKGSWELEAIHHKLYLENNPPEIQQFSISHGFNIFTINRGFSYNHFLFRVGLGCVFTHPETEIRNKISIDTNSFFKTRYYASGPVLDIGINRRWYLIKRLFLNTEVKNTFAYARIPIAEGHASFFTSSFHITAGLGFDFISKSPTP